MSTLKGKVYDCVYPLLSDKHKYELEYYRVHRKRMDISDPKGFTQKLYWIMRYNEVYNKDLIRCIYDKYHVREYIEKKGCSELLIDLVGNWNSADKIDFENIPKNSIFKITQSSGMNLIYRDDMDLEHDLVRKTLQKWLTQSRMIHTGFGGFYFDGKSSIICEKLICDTNGKVPDDIRFFCCNGEPQFIQVDIDTIDENQEKKEIYKRNNYNLDWELIPVDFFREHDETIRIERPQNLDKMIEIARVLSEDFLFVRVDLYNVDGKIYFGELTPVPGNSGIIDPVEFDEMLGEKIILPDRPIF